MENFKLTRIAPTPSGFLHLGNLYSFLLTYSLANKYKSKILLRIDDLDSERIKKKYIQDIFDTLDFLEISFDLGPKNLKDFEHNFSAHHRLELYKKSIDELIGKKLIFACECSRNKIAKMHPRGFYTGHCQSLNVPHDRQDTSFRIITPIQNEVTIKTLTVRVSQKIPGILRDFVVRKKDGTPSYQLQSVIDDIHFGVDFIVRGNDLFGSSFAQSFLASQLRENNFSNITFHHHDLIMGKKNKKLSKSAGDTSIQFLRKRGKKKEDVFILLGKMLGLKEEIKCIEDFSSASFKSNLGI
ncbi:glutamate--tRNA ligase family protein [Belliella sp. DSM 107340]|uniref:Glutamate--tRNA ligase family protein n=1 Tax=Belliella calami TaxID=2923436 RepID=A0ABS9USC2_9BACT|nr:glutamate--tRNA ligase family protein [Belliella calami]MCH7399403.1 glutamate--tRNA ligase family protein [Belliella calami]